MNQTAARRARILRLRTIEHRIAAVRLAQADAAHTAVEQVALRVVALRNQVNVAEGLQNGSDLQSVGELADRLDRARLGLDRSLAEAADVRDARDAERIAARLKEDRTGASMPKPHAAKRPSVSFALHQRALRASKREFSRESCISFVAAESHTQSSVAANSGATVFAMQNAKANSAKDGPVVAPDGAMPVNEKSVVPAAELLASLDRSARTDISPTVAPTGDKDGDDAANPTVDSGPQPTARLFRPLFK